MVDEQFELDPTNEVDTHKTEVNFDAGSRMYETDSMERIIDGLKSASDGARHLVARQEADIWDAFADLLDKVRVAVVRMSEAGRPMSDSEPTKRRKGVETALPAIEAYSRVYDGLNAAASAARQMATSHRMDLRWSIYAAQLERMRDQSSDLVRAKKAARQTLVGLH